MSSLILELQRDAMDDKVPVSTLLRKALVVARKLNLEEFGAWVEKELNGYQTGSKPPAYRTVAAEIRSFNPVYGWIPLVWPGEVPKEASQVNVGPKVAEFEDILARAPQRKGPVTLGLPPALEELINQFFNDYPFRSSFLVSDTSLQGILEAVRQYVLKWSLDLESKGILGENMSFTPEEKQKAEGGPVYNISHSTGVFLGNVKADALQVGDYNSIFADLKRLGIPQKERNELENIVDELKTTGKQPEKKAKLLKAGADWVMRNAANLGSLSETIRKWFTQEP